MKKLLTVARVMNAQDLLTAVGDMVGARAEEILSNDIYRIGLYEETLSDGSKVLGFWMRPETAAETKREKS